MSKNIDFVQRIVTLLEDNQIISETGDRIKKIVKLKVFHESLASFKYNFYR